MQSKSIFFNSTAFLFIFVAILLIATAVHASFSQQSFMKPDEGIAEVIITSDNYVVKDNSCEATCTATIQSGDTNIYVEYKLDDASVEFLDIINVVQRDQTINAYIDSSEIEKINAVIAGGKL